MGTLFGLAAFLAFLLLAVQLLASLYAASVVTGVAYDAAKQVATGDASTEEATSRARQLLGRSADGATLSWVVDATSIELRIAVDAPQVLAADVARSLPFATIDRTVVVRRERQR